MFKKVQAKFCRDSRRGYIEVSLPDLDVPLYLWAEGIAHCCEALSKREVEQVVSILSHDKEAMLKQRNFPPIYDEMLSELIEVRRERYGVKKDKNEVPTYSLRIDPKGALTYSVGIDKLEEMLKEYFNLKRAHIYSVVVGDNRRDLVLSFREVEE